MNRRIFTTMLAGGAYPARAFLAEDPKEILEKSAKAYQALHSYYFEGRTVSETTIRSKTASRELGFVVAFEEPNKFRLEFLYPKAGNWLRVSDGDTLEDSRSISKEPPTRSPVTEQTLNILKSSPLYNFERLSETAQGLILMPSESVEVAGKRVDCYVIQFAAHRRELRDTERPGPSMVWIAKDSYLVLREEIRFTESEGKELSATRRMTTITRFVVNQEVPPKLLSTARAPGR